MSVTTSPRSRPAERRSQTSTTTTVAVVEDHPVVLAGLRQVLADAAGVELAGVFPSVDAAVSDGFRGADVVLIDLVLGDRTDPADNIERLTAAGAHVVAFCADESRYLLRVAAEAGAEPVALRGTGPEELVEALRRAARGEVPAPGPTRRRTARGEDYVAVLSRRERETLALYASGEKSERVAEELGISQETVNDYVGRIRAKYRRAGRSADTKIDLYKRAVEDGILPAPGLTGG